MNTAGVRRHYRVGQKEVEINQQNLLPLDKKKKYMVFGGLLLFICFLEGLFIGVLLGKNR